MNTDDFDDMLEKVEEAAKSGSYQPIEILPATAGC